MLPQLAILSVSGKLIRVCFTPITAFLISNKLTEIEMVCWFLVMQAIQSRAIFEAGLSIIYRREFAHAIANYPKNAYSIINHVEVRLFQTVVLFLVLIFFFGWVYFRYHNFSSLVITPFALSIILAAVAQILFFWILKLEIFGRYFQSQFIQILNQVTFIFTAITTLYFDFALFAIPIALCVSNIAVFIAMSLIKSKSEFDRLNVPSWVHKAKPDIKKLIDGKWKRIGLVFSTGFLFTTLQFWVLPLLIEIQLSAAVMLVMSLFRAVQTFWETVMSSLFTVISSRHSKNQPILKVLFFQSILCLFIGLLGFSAIIFYEVFQSNHGTQIPFINLPTIIWISAVGVKFLSECLVSIISNSFRCIGIEPNPMVACTTIILSFIFLVIGLIGGMDHQAFLLASLPRLVYFLFLFFKFKTTYYRGKE